jgi:NAD-dependent deacetylase
MNWTKLQELSEILKNFAEVLAIIGGVFALWKWLYERHDRSTDVLLELAKKFGEPECVQGRTLIEDDVAYGEIFSRLHIAVLEASEPIPLKESKLSAEDNARLKPLDHLLGFYVLLHGIRRARQTSDAPLKTCFRYWLTQYYCPYRPAFRAYVDTFYPTLKTWLRQDEKRLIQSRRFFTPDEFGWAWNEKKTNEQFRRVIDGRVFVVTGSGISADSGIPTFRGPEGYWRELDPQKLATKRAFERQPRVVWEWYGERREMIKKAAPNAAHNALVTLASGCEEFLLVTQNVDDLHERATAEGRGLPPSKIVHIHGKIFVTRCVSCDYEVTDVRESPNQGLPACPKCGARVRPGVVWFDEDLDPNEEERVNAFLRKGPCDVVLIIGTTATFDYIRDWVLTAAGHRGWLLEINPEETALSRFANQTIRDRGAKILPELVKTTLERGPVGFKPD